MLTAIYVVAEAAISHSDGGCLSVRRLYPSRRKRHRDQWPECCYGRVEFNESLRLSGTSISEAVDEILRNQRFHRGFPARLSRHAVCFRGPDGALFLERKSVA